MAFSASVPGLGAWATASPGCLTPAELVDGVVAADRMISHLHAVQSGLFAELARPGRAGDVTALVDALAGKAGQASKADGTVDVDVLEALVEEQAQRMAAAEVGVALKISPMAAQRRVGEAIDLVHGLPATFQALRHGEIDRSKAHIIADRTSMLEPQARRQVEERVINLAGDRAPRRLRDLVDRAAIAADPGAANKRRKKARTERDVTHRTDNDGMGTVTAHLTAEGALAVFTLLDLIAATRMAGDSRRVGERRADAATDIAETLLTTGHIDLRPLLHPGGLDDAAGPADPAPTGVRTVCPDQPVSGGRDDSAAAGNSGGSDDSRCAEQSVGMSDTPGREDPMPGREDPTCGEESVGTGAGSATADNPSDDKQPSGSQLATLDATPVTSAAPDATNSLEMKSSTATSRAGKPVRRAAPQQTCPTCGHGSAPVWLPSRQGRPVDLVLTMSITTLAALDNLPGHLAGHGAVTAEFCRALIPAAKSVTLLILNPETGTAVGVGERAYVPRQKLRDQALVLSPTCTWTGCSQPAWKCDLDHEVPYNHAHPEQGGRTRLENLPARCRWHHLLKTHACDTRSHVASGLADGRAG